MGESSVISIKQEWEELAHLDPLWAILVRKDKRLGKWDREEFFESGQSEIDILMASCGISAGDNGRVLDFGCGVGRLSRPLQKYFAEVHGVDISEEMIRLAKQFTHGCKFVVNDTGDLKLFRDDFFDFVYSNIVLQHQPEKRLAKAYIREFIRVIKPGAKVVFQMPYRRTLRHILQPRRRLYSLLKRCGIPASVLYNNLNLAPVRGICLSSEEIIRAVSLAGGQIIRSYPDAFNYYSVSYEATKR